MIEQFKDFIEQNQLFDFQDKILLGFSGGPDSVVLAHLLRRLSVPFALAHCNFKLRGKDSDLDESFSRAFAQKLGIDIFVKRCPAKDYASSRGVSIEVAARELRYQWFYQLRREHGFDYIATAHNADDNLETFFVNLLRGTGLKGLAGIPVKDEERRVVRPLLFAFKKQILDYCRDNGLSYRIDRTNEQTVFMRNKLRHLVLPLLDQIRPGWRRVALSTIKYLSQAERYLSAKIDQELKNYVFERGSVVEIDVNRLKKDGYYDLFLYEILVRYGFRASQVRDILSKRRLSVGAKFSGEHNLLIIDREHYLIVDKRFMDFQGEEYLIERVVPKFCVPGLCLEMEKLGNKDLNLKQPSNVAFFDIEEVVFPLKLRRWRQGDYFYPFGMRGKKKLSDFFVSQKMSLYDKRMQWILEDAKGRIMWVLGRRSDNRFRVRKNTKEVLKIKVLYETLE